ncbi:MAG TPA: response regulator [Gammaproteobacteria bacterium]|nr:response regulator [Gammaproteobacteria bacterium]
MATSKGRVLIADDQFAVRQLLRLMLQEDGYEVVGEATNGESALEMCDRLRPQLLCLDIFMPHKDGMEVLQQVRVEYPQLKVLIISAESTSDRVKEALALGAAGFIVKPFNSATVLDAVAQVMV